MLRMKYSKEKGREKKKQNIEIEQSTEATAPKSK